MVIHLTINIQECTISTEDSNLNQSPHSMVLKLMLKSIGTGRKEIDNKMSIMMKLYLMMTVNIQMRYKIPKLNLEISNNSMLRKSLRGEKRNHSRRDRQSIVLQKLDILMNSTTEQVSRINNRLVKSLCLPRLKYTKTIKKTTFLQNKW